MEKKIVTKNAKTVATSSNKKTSSVYSKSTNASDFIMVDGGILVPVREYRESIRDRW